MRVHIGGRRIIKKKRNSKRTCDEPWTKALASLSKRANRRTTQTAASIAWWLMARRPTLPCVGFFFFQAKDGIRNIGVTGVQTCALPIYRDLGFAPAILERDSVVGRIRHDDGGF